MAMSCVCQVLSVYVCVCACGKYVDIERNHNTYFK